MAYAKPSKSKQSLRKKSSRPSKRLYEQRIALVFGLGNPDARYEHTWHNIGLFLIQAHMPQFATLSKSLFARRTATSPALGLPTVYVNQAGETINELRKKIGFRPEELLVVHDDADIQFPFAKLSFGASSAGHKGIQSIMDRLKTRNFWRLRIGIQTTKKRKPAMDLVLKKLKSGEQKRLQKMAERFGEILERLTKQPPQKLNLPRDYFV